MSSKYKFRDQAKLYFVTCTVVYWLDPFIRNEYRNVLLDGIKYCQKKKGLEIYGWCLMTSHLHMIIGSQGEKMDNIMQSFKTNTSRKIKEMLKGSKDESRKEWMLWMMERSGKLNKHNGSFQFWQEGNHPIELFDNKIMQQKLDYVHDNPVEAGFVEKPEDWLWSSARDYAGSKGLLDILYIE
jgi:putative transposase